MRTTIVVALVLVLLVLALPAIAETETLDSGATLIDDQVLATEGVPKKTVEYVDDLLGGSGAKHENHGGSLNIPD